MTFIYQILRSHLAVIVIITFYNISLITEINVSVKLKSSYYL